MIVCLRLLSGTQNQLKKSTLNWNAADFGVIGLNLFKFPQRDRTKSVCLCVYGWRKHIQFLILMIRETKGVKLEVTHTLTCSESSKQKESTLCTYRRFTQMHKSTL